MHLHQQEEMTMKDFIKGYVIPFILGVAVTGALLGVINLASYFKGF